VGRRATLVCSSYVTSIPVWTYSHHVRIMSTPSLCTVPVRLFCYIRPPSSHSLLAAGVRAARGAGGVAGPRARRPLMPTGAWRVEWSRPLIFLRSGELSGADL